MENSGSEGTTEPIVGLNNTLIMGMISARYAALNTTLKMAYTKNLTNWGARPGAYCKIRRYIFIYLKLVKALRDIPA